MRRGAAPMRRVPIGVGFGSDGTLYVTHTLKGAQKTYGTFAGVIGLLSWMYLLAQVTMFAAEVNVVRHRRLWPRSLFGPDHLTKRLEEAAGAA